MTINQKHAVFRVSDLWRTAEVFTPAPGFGKGCELQQRTITIRPGENRLEALIREGFDVDSRVQVIDI